MLFSAWFAGTMHHDTRVSDSSQTIIFDNYGGRKQTRQEYFTFTNVAFIKMYYTLASDVHVWLNFSAVPPSARPKLVLNYTAHHQGKRRHGGDGGDCTI